MADYDDKSYYEIQLEQKQLVLILMLMVAICVLFFFLGVYYVRGREPMQASVPRATPTATPTPTPTLPEKVATETVSRFFEPGEGKGAATKEDFEGKVLAESLPAESPTKAPKGEGKEKPTPAPKETPSPKASPKATVEPTRVAPPEHVESAGGTGTFIVQIAAVGDEDRARETMSKLKSLGFPVYLKTEPSGEARYKIRVGPYSEREKANQAKDGLRSQGYPGAFVSAD